jgi:hypothetical protein
MRTSTTWILAQVAPPGACCQMVSVPRLTARASAAPPGAGASVAVPGGSGGSCRQDDPAPVMIWPRPVVVMTEAEPPGPNDAEVRAAPCSGSGGDRVQ